MRFLEAVDYHGWELNLYKDEDSLKFIGINGDICFREESINKSEVIQKFKRFIYTEKESPFNYSKSTLDWIQAGEDKEKEQLAYLEEQEEQEEQEEPVNITKKSKKKEKFYKKLVKELCESIDGLEWDHSSFRENSYVWRYNSQAWICEYNSFKELAKDIIRHLKVEVL